MREPQCAASGHAAYNSFSLRSERRRKMHDREAQSSAREVHALPGPKAFLFVRPATCLLGVTMRNKFQNKINSFDSMRDVLADEANLKAVNSNQGFKDETEDF